VAELPPNSESVWQRIIEPFRTPNRSVALQQYRRRARFYDFQLALGEPLRRQAIERLALKRGDTVLDVGCGTGLSFAMIEKAIGEQGTLVGIEQSPDMIEQARARVQSGHWSNVTLICSPVEEAAIEVEADAALFNFTHDILRTSEAVANVVRHLKQGARVVATGLKWATRPWELPTNLFVAPAALESVTSFEGLREPWSHLSALIPSLDVQSILGGGVFIATGRVRRTAMIRT
jgi:ubiquinone/menaquinone biosynthesis C-methylase UbiE